MKLFTDLLVDPKVIYMEVVNDLESRISIRKFETRSDVWSDMIILHPALIYHHGLCVIVRADIRAKTVSN